MVPTFIAAADLVMILRLYAMWNQSKGILYFLLFIYVPQFVLSFVFAGIYFSPSLNSNLSVTVVQVIDFSFCNGSLNNDPSHLLLGVLALRISFSVILLILAVIPTLKVSVVMYKATKLWQPNHYMQLFVKDGILYFLANIIYNVARALAWLQTDITGNSPSQVILSLLYYTTLCPIMPRFVISVRELYDRDLRGRWQGIDTGFGALSQPFSSGSAVLSAIQFADVAPGQEVAGGEADDSEAIRLEMLGDGTRQV